MNRHNIRIAVVRILYTIDINKIDVIDDLLDNIIKYAVDPVDSETFDITSDWYIDVKNYVNNIFDNLEAIDSLITKNLENYTLKRLNYVDRQIIRLATYEMMYTSTPKSIIINEALEITKEYSEIDTNLQTKFSNKLLDKIKKELENE